MLFLTESAAAKRIYSQRMGFPIKALLIFPYSFDNSRQQYMQFLKLYTPKTKPLQAGDFRIFWAPYILQLNNRKPKEETIQSGHNAFLKKRCRYRHCCPPLTIRQYSSVRCRAAKQHRFLTKSLTHSEKIFSLMKSRNAGIPAYFKWRDNINGQIFRYGKYCALIVLSKQA